MAQVKQLRLVVHAEDYERALVFFRDVLGMPTAEAYAGDGGAEVTILEAGRATIELANTAQVEMIDDVEVGRRVAPHLRLALEVDDCDAATRAALGGGARSVAPPTRTPWDSLNARMDAPAGVHLTLFQELGGATPGPADTAPSGSRDLRRSRMDRRP
jgi:predicted enzyme related to lactoylglutathione lyase